MTLTGCFAGVVRGKVGPNENRAGAPQEAPASSGQCHATRRPVEQRRADDRFQLPNLTGQRWLRHLKAVRRATDVPLLGHGDEIPHVPQFHPDTVGVSNHPGQVLDRRSKHSKTDAEKRLVR
jgi:hypothetical protein